MPTTRLIINADDMGLTRGISDAIILAHREGVLTSTSLMVNQEATEYAVDLLRHTPTLGCGIHLNLCQGKPVLPASLVRSLVDERGNFQGPAAMGDKLVRWGVSTREIEEEFVAQIELMQSYGLEPTHADSHHRFHLYPASAIAFRRAMERVGLRKARAPKKRHWPADGWLGSAHAGALHRRVAVTSYNTFLQNVLFRNLRLPDAGVAFAPKFRGRLDLLDDAWISTVEQMTPGTYEMWCHPGFVQNGFSESDRLRDQRVRELEILIGALFRRAIAQSGVELISFRNL